MDKGQKKWSGKRDSNSRPRPWQGRALPAELFPHYTVNAPLSLLGDPISSPARVPLFQALWLCEPAI